MSDEMKCDAGVTQGPEFLEPEQREGHALRMGGSALIQQERSRQIYAEGWDAAHDDEHRLSQLALAGLSYVSVAASQVRMRDGCVKGRLPIYWPFSQEWWKPSDDPVRNLVKAGALIAAEIDRLLRLKDRDDG